MSKLFRLRGKPIDAPSDRTMVYYFERAISHYPHDDVVYMIYGIHNHKINNFDKAKSLYLKTIEINPENIEAHYNLGLLYFELKEYSKARKHAMSAYDKGFPLQGLKNKLKSRGYWEKDSFTEMHKKNSKSSNIKK
jgi:tetratricopeptide (TPR) repeat protein